MSATSRINTAVVDRPTDGRAGQSIGCYHNKRDVSMSELHGNGLLSDCACASAPSTGNIAQADVTATRSYSRHSTNNINKPDNPFRSPSLAGRTRLAPATFRYLIESVSGTRSDRSARQYGPAVDGKQRQKAQDWSGDWQF